MAPRLNILFVIALILLAGILPIPVYYLEARDAVRTPDSASLPDRNLPPFEQQAQALAGLVIKPAYMLLSLVVILALTGQGSADISALRRGQIAFLAGETFCAINFYVYKHESILSEYLHSYGMALAFGFTSFALLEGLQARFLRHGLEGSRAGAIARFVIPILAVLAFIPLLSPLQSEAYAVSVFGFPYSYTRFAVYEIYERRVLPALSLIAFVIAYLSLLRKGGPPIPFITRVFACAGLGALGFSLFRVTLNAIFVNDLVWFEFWEEATELMFVGAIAFMLWQFRTALLHKTPMLEMMGLRPE